MKMISHQHCNCRFSYFLFAHTRSTDLSGPFSISFYYFISLVNVEQLLGDAQIKEKEGGGGAGGVSRAVHDTMGYLIMYFLGEWKEGYGD